MDEKAVGVIALVLLIVGGVVAAVAVAGGILYATDYGLEATVIDKDCAGGGGVLGGGGGSSSVTVRTKLFGVEHTVQDFPNAQCGALRAGDDGNFVRYHLRSGQTTLYEREGGSCIWDSEAGLGC